MAKKNWSTFGGMPVRIETPFELEDFFRMLATQMISRFCEIIVEIYPEGNYPLQEYYTDDTEAIQISIEADIFATEVISLRRDINNYTIQLHTTNGDSIGNFEFDFSSNDPLTKVIHESIKNAISTQFD